MGRVAREPARKLKENLGKVLNSEERGCDVGGTSWMKDPSKCEAKVG